MTHLHPSWDVPKGVFLYFIAETRAQPCPWVLRHGNRHPSPDEWIMKIGQVYTVELRKTGGLRKYIFFH